MSFTLISVHATQCTKYLPLMIGTNLLAACFCLCLPLNQVIPAVACFKKGQDLFKVHSTG